MFQGLSVGNILMFSACASVVPGQAGAGGGTGGTGEGCVVSAGVPVVPVAVFLEQPYREMIKQSSSNGFMVLGFPRKQQNLCPEGRGIADIQYGMRDTGYRIPGYRCSDGVFV